MKKNFGFTLLELLVTLAIVAVLVALAVPGMSTLTNTQNVNSPVKGVRSMARYGHELASDKVVPVVMCSSTNGTSCANSQTWESGWILFVDRNGNGFPDLGGGTCDDDEDCIVRSQDALAAGVSLRADVNRLSFDDQGETGSTAAFRLCGANAEATNDKEHSRTISVNAAGLVSVRQGTTQCP